MIIACCWFMLGVVVGILFAAALEFHLRRRTYQILRYLCARPARWITTLDLHRDTGASIGTVHLAVRELEEHGLIATTTTPGDLDRGFRPVRSARFVDVAEEAE